MRTPPRFKSDDPVFHRATGRRGKVMKVINLGDEEDIRIQGYCYYVLIGREVWSVPESGLLLDSKTLRKNLNKSKANLEVAPFILPLDGLRTSKEASAPGDPESLLIDAEEAALKANDGSGGGE